MFGSLLNLESSLWDDFQRLQWEMDNLLNRNWAGSNIRAVAGGAFPTINVGSTEKAVHVYAFAPGIDPNSLDVSLERNLLTIVGERKAQPQEDGAKQNYYLNERFAGSFRRVISLPEGVDPDKVEAVYRNGVLSITVAKQEAAKPRQIQVTS